MGYESPCLQYLLYRINAINHLSYHEKLAIMATLKAIDEPQYQCAQCVIRWPEAARDAKGCKGGEAVRHVIQEFKLTQCVGNYFDYQVLEYLKAHNAYEGQGVLPYSGAFMDQPSKMMEVFDVIGAHKRAKIDADRMREKLKAQGKGPRG